jgi:hypothetical protein
MREAITPEMLRELLRYDPDTGKLFWRKRDPSTFANARAAGIWTTRFSEKETFLHLDRGGYLRGDLLKCSLLAHRVAWAIETGSWPRDALDHINGERTDNRFCNLREATRSENARNSRQRAGASRFKGVTWHETSEVWRARIRLNGTNASLGLFASEIDAAKAYDAAAREHFGAYARPNFPEVRA